MTIEQRETPQPDVKDAGPCHSPVLEPLRDRMLAGEYLTGTFLSLGSDAIAEIAAYSGFDFLIIDLEHGMGGLDSVVRQLRAVAGSGTSALVRLSEQSGSAIRRVLDLGAVGLVVPGIRIPDEVRAIVEAMRYPPRGTRGVHRTNRATWFGKYWSGYLHTDLLTTLVQIETAEAVEAVEEIAAIDGVDGLLVGPGDLTHGLGIPEEYQNPKFTDAVSRVASAARNSGKGAAIVAPTIDQIPHLKKQGYTVIAVSSDAGVVASGLRRVSTLLRK